MINYLVILLLCTTYAQGSLQRIDLAAGEARTVYIGVPDVIAHAEGGTSISGASSNATSSSSAHVHITIVQQLLQEISALRDGIKNNLPTHQTLYANKFKIIGASLAGLYGYTWYKLISLSYKLSNGDNWHDYQEKLSLEELLQIPQNNLAQDLVKDIQQAYAAQAIESFFTPFILFVKDIDQEIANLEQLIALEKRIEKLSVSILFPWHKLPLADAQQKLQRGLYLKNVVLTWLSTFKIESNTKKLSIY